MPSVIDVQEKIERSHKKVDFMLNYFERKILSIIFGPVLASEFYRIRFNGEIRYLNVAFATYAYAWKGWN